MEISSISSLSRKISYSNSEIIMKFRQVANWDGHGLNPGIQVFGLSCFQNLLAVYPTNGWGFPGPQRAKLANDLAKPSGDQTTWQFTHTSQNLLRVVRRHIHIIASSVSSV